MEQKENNHWWFYRISTSERRRDLVVQTRSKYWEWSLGKGKEYTRPVLIINSEGSENCICVPLSSKIKNTKYSCIIKTEDNKLHTALMFQIRSIDKRRLKEKVYDLNEEEYGKVKIVFDKLFKI